MIKVKSNLPGNKIALWDRHPDHPGGEVSIHGDITYTVAKTANVKAALRDGRLVEVEAKPAPAKRRKLRPEV